MVRVLLYVTFSSKCGEEVENEEEEEERWGRSVGRSVVARGQRVCSVRILCWLLAVRIRTTPPTSAAAAVGVCVCIHRWRRRRWQPTALGGYRERR